MLKTLMPGLTTSANQKGFTLLEVLVSLLVLSIGLFGMLSIIITSLKMNSSSVYRTIASQQAYAMAETLRANPTAVGTVNAASAVAFSSTPAAYSATCLQSVGCARGSTSANGYVQMSMRMWLDQLAALLPKGTGTVCQDSTPNDGTPVNWQCDGTANAPYVVKVCWDESRISASSSVAGTAASGYWAGGSALCTYTNL
jgi:type IV pilus assembly protein PilV